eukprot:NODE_290_length_1246_cov_1324.590643_g171_i0.p1 GENE.NODE_290_length_1246_cov_1324.590643_g171_i0~~NODE_290_length_1246_cov_1324.590643_g171_i0.p1  ORF type:complete len:232 (+),score=67.90 NODE_290_length_1246_cov_1324.590643_g171_i0:469-1164(+)
MDRTHNRPSLRRLLQHLPSLLPNWAPHRRRTSGFGSTNCNCRHPNQASKDCEDTASWLDWDGDSCSSYYQNHWCVDGEAPSWVEGWANVEGVDATKACCGCGPSLCGNILGWLDSDGDSCSAYYQNDWCVDRVPPSWVASYANSEGVDATRACCVCGGGVGAGAGQRAQHQVRHPTTTSKPRRQSAVFTMMVAGAGVMLVVVVAVVVKRRRDSNQRQEESVESLVSPIIVV